MPSNVKNIAPAAPDFHPSGTGGIQQICSSRLGFQLRMHRSESDGGGGGSRTFPQALESICCSRALPRRPSAEFAVPVQAAFTLPSALFRNSNGVGNLFHRYRWWGASSGATRVMEKSGHILSGVRDGVDGRLRKQHLYDTERPLPGK